MAKHPTATHEDFARESEVKLPSERSFGITFCVVFAVFAGISFWFNGSLWPWLGGASLGFGAIGLILPQLLAPLNKLWFRFGLLLHKVMTPLIMGILFYGLFTPVGFLMRLAGKDPMRVRGGSDAQSYWIEREPDGVDNHMKNQF